MKKLMILDGNSIVNRAFYGIRLLTNSEGTYTNAVYGFINILLKYLDEEKPDFLCVAFDESAPTFRHLQFENYKAGRKGMPDELRQQMPILKDVLSAMNISMISAEGYEADDIIGTVSAYCLNASTECVILTGDKDNLQLATDSTKIKLVTTRMGSTETVDYTQNTVFEKYGVSPTEFIDVKALMGDSSDNIPGVLGIGEKTALDLIKRFKSIEHIYENIDEIDVKESVRSKLIAGRDNAFMSKQLATIDLNIPVGIKIEDYAIKQYDNEKLTEIFKKLNFSNLLKRLKLEAKPDLQQAEFIETSDLESIKNSITSKNIMYYYSKDGYIALATDETNITVAEIAFEELSDLFSNSSIKKIGHNLKDDIVKLKAYDNAYFDTMIAAYIIDPSRSTYNISDLSETYLGYSSSTIAQTLLSIIKLTEFFNDKMKQNNQQDLFYNIEMPLVSVLADMQTIGFSIDKQKLIEFRDDLDVKIKELTLNIHKFSENEFNINSTKQLGELLFEKLRLPVIKKTKTGYSTDVEVLEKLKGTHEIIDYILEYRKLTKLKSTYADGLLNVIDKKTGKIHSNFNQTIAVTGRISSTEPNIQNIPIRDEFGRGIRKVFKTSSEDYCLVSADYSQIELRVLAHIANDANMIDAFKNNIDIHTKTASQVFGISEGEVTSLMRSRAKAVNFGIVYGIGDFSLSQDLGIKRSEAKEYIENYLANFVGVKNYMKNIIAEGKEAGFVTTLFGRRRYLPELQASNFITRSFGERIALNTPIQGSAADIIKIAMVRVFKSLKEKNMKSRLILQVHDELIIETHKTEIDEVKEILKNEMENAAALIVPLSVNISVGQTWFDAK